MKDSKTEAFLRIPQSWLTAFPKYSLRTTALCILADIVFRQRIRKEGAVAVSITNYAETHCVTREAVRQMFVYLERVGVVKRDYRATSNTMFVALNATKLKQVTAANHANVVGIDANVVGMNTKYSKEYLVKEEKQEIELVPTKTVGTEQNAIAKKTGQGQGQVQGQDQVQRRKKIPLKKERAKTAAQVLHNLSVKSASLPAPKVANTSAAVTCWQHTLPLHFDTAWVELTQKQRGQLGRIVKVLGMDGITLIRWSIAHWTTVTDRVRHDTGSNSYPKKPDIGYLLKHMGNALTVMQEHLAPPIKPKQVVAETAVPVVTPSADKPIKAGDMSEEELLKLIGLAK